MIDALLSCEFAAGERLLDDLKRPQHRINRIGADNCLDLATTIQSLDNTTTIDLTSLVGSGASGCYVDKDFVDKYHLPLEPLAFPVQVFNADGSPNDSGPILHTVTLMVRIGEHLERLTLSVTNTGTHPIILGFQWLRRHNPSIDWSRNKLLFDRCPHTCQDYVPWIDTPTSSSLSPDDDSPDHFSHPHRIRSLVPELDVGDRLLYIAEPLQLQEHIRSVNPDTTTTPPIPPNSLDTSSIPERYRTDFSCIFEQSSFDSLSPHRKWDHAIELTDDAKPFSSKIYPLSRDEQVELDKFIGEHLASGRIRPSKSPIASPFFFVKKKDGSLRPVQDYRRLNAITIKNRYPLPLITDIMNKIKGAKYFSKFDIRWGYNNVRIKPGDEWKAAFITSSGLYEPLVMYFGLINSPATFQSMMDELFIEVTRKGVVIIYMDDVLIFTRDLDSHRTVTREVLQIMKDNKLSLKPEKCEWEKTEVEYLGHIISADGVRMDPKKVQAILDWPTPKSKKELQQFLGLANYYRRFIDGFAFTASPLNSLTGNTPWRWEPQHDLAFHALKLVLASDSTLSFPNDTGQFRVEADSSGFATGAVLSQKQEEVWKPIAFLSRSLSEVERNYEIHDREMLAIMRALDEWKHHLKATTIPFEIHTDHKNLQYFMTARKLNRRQARWSSELQDFFFTLHHRPGKSFIVPDSLSRRPDYDKGSDDNTDITLLNPHHIRRLSASLLSDHDVFIPRIRNCSLPHDPTISQRKTLYPGEWTCDNGLTLWQNRIYVPPDPELRNDIIRAHHDHITAGHPGRAKTAELVLRMFWWPRIHVDVRNYIHRCDLCQRTKTSRRLPHGLLEPNLIPQEPWDTISVDLITDLPTSNGYDSILVVVDRFSKYIRIIPTNKDVSSLHLATLYRDHVWKDFGLPRCIISDRGTIFVSQFTKPLNSLLDIHSNVSTAYHPQTDGQTERVNQDVEQYLRLFTNYRQTDWADWLSLAEFAHNDKTHSSTGHSPFLLIFGRHPRRPNLPFISNPSTDAENFVEKMRLYHEEAHAQLERAARDMKTFYDRNHLPLSLDVGNQVLLQGENLKSNRPSKKLDHRRWGPFTITEKIGTRAYKLKLPPSWRIHPVFHISRLHPYTPNPDTPPPPPPELVNGEYEHEIEEILTKRYDKRRRKTLYLVKWLGFPHEENEWLTENELEHAQDALNRFNETP